MNVNVSDHEEADTRLLLHAHQAAGVNAARYNLFRQTCLSKALPPNQDCLKHHLARSNYQIAIHRRALERFVDATSAVGHGWKVEDRQLV